MSNIKSGGPAFPVLFENRSKEPKDGFDGEPVPPMTAAQYSGLSMRDHFAGLAMQGMCAHESNWGLNSQQIVKQAYAIADVMLAERGKP